MLPFFVVKQSKSPTKPQFQVHLNSDQSTPGDFARIEGMIKN